MNEQQRKLIKLPQSIPQPFAHTFPFSFQLEYISGIIDISEDSNPILRIEVFGSPPNIPKSDGKGTTYDLDIRSKIFIDNGDSWKIEFIDVHQVLFTLDPELKVPNLTSISIAIRYWTNDGISFIL